jgi:hypothetical protein
MTDDDLDPRLAGAVRDYALGGVRPIDAMAIAHAAAAPSAASFFGSTVADRGSGFRRLTAPSGRLAFAAAAVAVVAVVGYSLVGSGTAGPGGSSEPPPPASAPSTRPPGATPAPTPQPSPFSRQLEPGEYEIPWAPVDARIRLTVPAGWSTDETGAYLFMTKGAGPWGPGDPGLPDLGIHDVKSVVPEICSSSVPAMAAVGPAADDLVAALADQAGWVEKSNPVEVTLGGFPAWKIVGRLPDACPEPAEGVTLWANADGTVYVPLEGSDGLTSFYVVDVNGKRLVIAASGYRTATADDIAERDAILATIRIEPGIPAGVNVPDGVDALGSLGPGRHSVDVSGRSISFTLPPGGGTPSDWERFGNLYISNSTVGSQAAEAMILWIDLGGGPGVTRCDVVLHPVVASSLARDAADVASTAGTELVSGPTDLIVGGRPAKRIVLTVKDDVGCDPGYFFAWDQPVMGAFWSGPEAGDTMQIWIVEMNDTGRRLFIEATTHPGAGPAVEEEIRQIIDSIELE